MESLGKLEEDPASLSVVLLAQLIKQVNQSAQLPNIESQPFVSASSRDEVVNALWFTSLALSLANVTIGLLCLQWIQEFNKQGDLFDDAEYFTLRAAREHGLKHWGAKAIISTLPVLLIASIVTFFIGLLVFIWGLTPKIVVPVFIILLATCALLIFTTFGPAFIARRQSSRRASKSAPMPFRSLQSWLVLRVTVFFTHMFTADWASAVFDCPDWLSLDRLWASWSPPPLYPISSSLANIPGSPNKVAAVHCLDQLSQESAKRGDWVNSLRLQRGALQLANATTSHIPTEHLLERLIRIYDSNRLRNPFKFGSLLTEYRSFFPIDNLGVFFRDGQFDYGKLQSAAITSALPLSGLLIQLVNTIIRRWDAEDLTLTSAFMTICVAIDHLLFHDQTAPQDIPELVSPLFNLARSTMSQTTLAAKSIAGFISVYFIKLCDGERRRAQQVVYVMSRHPDWPLFEEVLRDSPKPSTDDDGREVLPLDVSWVRHILDPHFVPPIDWDIKLPAEWASQPQYQSQEHENGRHGEAPAAQDEGVHFGHDEEKHFPMTTLPAGVLTNTFSYIRASNSLLDLPPSTRVYDGASVPDFPLPSMHDTRPVQQFPTIQAGVASPTRTEADGYHVASSYQPDGRLTELLATRDLSDARQRYVGGPGAEGKV